MAAVIEKRVANGIVFSRFSYRRTRRNAVGKTIDQGSRVQEYFKELDIQYG